MITDATETNLHKRVTLLALPHPLPFFSFFLVERPVWDHGARLGSLLQGWHQTVDRVGRRVLHRAPRRPRSPEYVTAVARADGRRVGRHLAASIADPD